MRFKKFMLESEEGRWATVKDIKIGTNSPIKYKPGISFNSTMKQFIGKHIYFMPVYPTLFNNKLWKHHYTDYIGHKWVAYFDSDWLKFDKEDPQQTHLFPND